MVAGGQTGAPTVMIAERAAALLTGKPFFKSALSFATDGAAMDGTHQCFKQSFMLPELHEALRKLSITAEKVVRLDLCWQHHYLSK